MHFLRNLKHTGAVAPSSRYLALEMAQAVRRHRFGHDRPLRILELGPGTGVITREIRRTMRKDDRLDIIEINPVFYRHIRSQFAGPQVRVFGMDVLDFSADQPYDVIISSIPYEQIPPGITEKIWRKQLALSTSGTTIAYYKYYRFNHFSCRFERALNQRLLTDEKLIWRNVPPAICYRLTVSSDIIADLSLNVGLNPKTPTPLRFSTSRAPHPLQSNVT